MPALTKVETSPRAPRPESSRCTGGLTPSRVAFDDEVETLAELILWQEQLPRSELPRCRYEAGLQVWLEELAERAE